MKNKKELTNRERMERKLTKGIKRSTTRIIDDIFYRRDQISLYETEGALLVVRTDSVTQIDDSMLLQMPVVDLLRGNNIDGSAPIRIRRFNASHIPYIMESVKGAVRDVVKPNPDPVIIDPDIQVLQTICKSFNITMPEGEALETTLNFLRKEGKLDPDELWNFVKGEKEPRVELPAPTETTEVPTVSLADPYAPVTIFVPSNEQILRISPGTGSDMTDEDYEKGYYDTIRYQQYEIVYGASYGILPKCGMVYGASYGILPKCGSEKILIEGLFRHTYDSTLEAIPDVLDFVFGDPDLYYVVICQSMDREKEISDLKELYSRADKTRSDQDIKRLNQYLTEHRDIVEYFINISNVQPVQYDKLLKDLAIITGSAMLLRTVATDEDNDYLTESSLRIESEMVDTLWENLSSYYPTGNPEIPEPEPEKPVKEEEEITKTSEELVKSESETMCAIDPSTKFIDESLFHFELGEIEHPLSPERPASIDSIILEIESRVNAYIREYKESGEQTKKLYLGYVLSQTIRKFYNRVNWKMIYFYTNVTMKNDIFKRERLKFNKSNIHEYAILIMVLCDSKDYGKLLSYLLQTPEIHFETKWIEGGGPTGNGIPHPEYGIVSRKDAVIDIATQIQAMIDELRLFTDVYNSEEYIQNPIHKRYDCDTCIETIYAPIPVTVPYSIIPRHMDLVLADDVEFRGNYPYMKDGRPKFQNVLRGFDTAVGEFNGKLVGLLDYLNDPEINSNGYWSAREKRTKKMRQLLDKKYRFYVLLPIARRKRRGEND